MRLTAEEKAELAAYDAAIDAEDTKMTLEEYEFSIKLDAKAQGKTVYKYILDLSPEERVAHRKRWKAAWYQSNRSRCDARKRASEKKMAKRNARFGAMLKAARIEAGLSRREFAKMAGRHYHTIERYEYGMIRFDWELFQRLLPNLGPMPEDYPRRSRK